MKRLKININFKFRFLSKSFRNKPFSLLDVGAGNHSASRITSLFPNCNYYGLDLDKEYNNAPEDFAVMKGFYELDLTKLDYGVIPDAKFDGIWMAHVIEHLYNGDQVVPHLLQKLAPGGYFYIEYPGQKSTTLPSMKGSLNFKDDPTHVRVYSVPELTQIFTANGCTVLRSGTRRNWYYILGMPFRIMYSLLKKGHVEGNIFWDALGFAEFLWVKKNK
ncbi:class I SAM-dependent methyltransferase [Chitinophaga pendula]|uniref:class I SAM-dependent methyltransferase n=1 Tax=Chitinophaga TaxID=79328 RepID=UPI000BB0C31A|nr:MULTISPECIES: class I SAM-dependent methyltransferase [Chitinophaga]ASZ10376.1 methyltransferase type 11 [Chitinophaga sp. MD30]UCJ06658.1 class I SAM-dependent methyltransferase [Chitinophaga pendula]